VEYNPSTSSNSLRIDQPTATTHHSKRYKSDAANSSAMFCLQRKSVSLAASKMQMIREKEKIMSFKPLEECVRGVQDLLLGKTGIREVCMVEL
jgi:hypothetical protein